MSKKKRKTTTHKVMRVSGPVLARLRRLKRDKESLDGLLRRLLGMPTRKGEPQPLKRFYLLPNDDEIVPWIAMEDEEQVRGIQVLKKTRAKLSGLTYKPSRPIEVREWK